MSHALFRRDNRGNSPSPSDDLQSFFSDEPSQPYHSTPNKNVTKTTRQYKKRKSNENDHQQQIADKLTTNELIMQEEIRKLRKDVQRLAPIPALIGELKGLVLELSEKLDDRSEQTEDGEGPLDEKIKLHSKSRFEMTRGELADLKAQSKSASTFIIALLPKFFEFKDIYRRSMKNLTTDEDFAKIPFDQNLINDLVAGAIKRKGSDEKTVRRDLANHLAKLNGLFRRLRDGQRASSGLLKECQLSKSHIKFNGLADCISEPQLFKQLDKAIDAKIAEERKTSKASAKKKKPTTAGTSSPAFEADFDDDDEYLSYLDPNMLQIDLQTSGHLNNSEC